MDYRDAYRHYERSGAYDGSASSYKHPMEDAFDRSRKRARSPSPIFDRYAAYPPPTDAWERDYRERSPYPATASAAAPYDDYREREADPYERDRALEWERYYRERNAEYAGGAYADRERYQARSRYEDDNVRDRDYRRSDHGYPYGAAPDTPFRRDGQSSNKAGEIAAPDPLQFETLLPFRSYAQMIKVGHPSSRDRSIEAPTTQELYEGYQGYRLAFTKKAMWAFFEQHRDEVWFNEKYAVAVEFAEARQSRKRVGREARKEAWLQELKSGKLDQIDFDMKPAAEAEEGTVITSRYGEQETLTGDQVTIPMTGSQLLIKSFPPDISREKLELHLKTRDGFKYLALGEPHSGKRWHRVGWAAYEEGTDMEETFKALDGKEIDNFTLHLALSSRPTNGKLRTVPEYANSFNRLTQDLKQVRQLLAQLEDEDRVLFGDEDDKWLHTSGSEAIMSRHVAIDPEVNEEELERSYDPDEDAIKREERRSRLKKHLDLHLDLLRTAYHCDYYLSLTCEFPEELSRRSPRHVRKQPAPGTLVEEPRESTNDESWAKSVDQKTSLLLSDEKSNLIEFGGKSVETELMNAAIPFVKEEEKEKHRCIVEVGGAQCGKLFKASIFVQKHVLNKHRAFLDEVAEGPIQQAKFFNNYVRDPCRTQASAAPPSAASLTPLSHRFAPPPAASPFDSPSPLFPTSRVGLIRLGGVAPEPSPSLGMRIGGLAPLPDPPKPLDPRAARSAPKSYQDLDGNVAEGDLDLAY